MKISSELVSKVRDTIFQELGIELPAVIEIHSQWATFPKVKIPRSALGMMAPMVESASVVVSVGFRAADENRGETAFVRYEYDYFHPCGGHNGYSHRFEIK